jgi:Mor family transcriptional regulator
LRERAAVETRDKPWVRPNLVGTTRVRRLLATDMDAVIADYAAGLGCVLLSRKYGIAENTVLARLKEAGVEVRTQGFLDPAALDEMVALRAEGWTLKALGQKYRMTRQTVASRLRTQG